MSAFPTSSARPTAWLASRFVLAPLLGVLCAAPLQAARAQAAAEPASAQAPAPSDSPFGGPEAGIGEASPLRLTLAHEATWKAGAPRQVLKNRSSLQVEYGEHLLENFFVQFKGKATAFFKKDHRRPVERTDAQVSQAYVQSSHGGTSVKAGIQTLPWGESMLSAVTDEVSPRDNRELFNFNLEELRLGQPMVVVDQYAQSGRWSAFWVPNPSFNKNPEPGSAYYFDPFPYRAEIEGDDGAEYGASWRRNFDSADITFMAASLLDNDYALRMGGDGAVTRSAQRFSMAGVALTYAFRNFVIRAEAAAKHGRAYNDAALQIVRRNAVDTYVGVDYRYSSSLTFGVEAMNQRIAHWNEVPGALPRSRQSVLFSLTKTFMHDDLSVNVLHFRNLPYRGNLTLVMNTLKWNDHLTLGLNLIYPDVGEPRSALWRVRDQKQIAFKAQYQF